MNWGILGHEWAVQLLHAQLVQGRSKQAYMFTGPPGIGRRTLALSLAQAINCLQPPEPMTPCLTCRSCLQFQNMKHPDLIITQADQVGGVLKVDQIRDIQHRLALAPYVAQYKVALFLRFEEAHASAANALLKTLEEPPERVIIMLTAPSSESVLPTIASRCEVIRLRPLPYTQVENGLVAGWDIPVEEAHLLGHISGGRPGYALRLSRNEVLLEQRQGWLDDLVHLLFSKRVARFAYAETLTKDKNLPLADVLQTWLAYWRDILLLTTGSGSLLANIDRQAEMEQLAGQLSIQTARKVIQAAENTLQLLGKNANPRLALEVLMLDLPFC
ncbi:MAG TPA: DNA polymerase III subunit [Anaerolineales bacterium]|nr:DNA polymerase III subunit [Anaerolineales bacterium]